MYKCSNHLATNYFVILEHTNVCIYVRMHVGMYVHTHTHTHTL